MTKVDIGWTDPGYVVGHFAHSIANTAVDMEYFGVMGKIHASIGSSLISAARNQIVHAFMAGESDYLWMVDSDMVLDKGHVMKLLDMAENTGADMVSGLAFMYTLPEKVLVPSVFYEGHPPMFDEGELYTRISLPENGEEVAATGLASTLIHRSVFEGLTPPRHEDYPWFDQIVLPTGQLTGEDTQFFVRAREAGFTLRICVAAETWHLKEVGMGRQDFDMQMEMARREMENAQSPDSGDV